VEAEEQMVSRRQGDYQRANTAGGCGRKQSPKMLGGCGSCRVGLCKAMPIVMIISQKKLARKLS